MKTNLPVCFAIFLWTYILSSPIDARASAPPELVFTQATWLSPNIIRIPFTFTGTLITVRARIDTLEGNFFFDTGANGLLLNNRYLGKPTAFGTESGGSVTGKVRVLGNTTLDTFLLDNLLLTQLKAEVIDLGHIERAKRTALLGIIGYEVFKDYEILFDYAARLLVMVKLDAKGNQIERIPDWEYTVLQSFPLEVSGHVAMISLKFGEKKRKLFGLDTGAEQNLLTKDAGARFLKDHFEIRRRVNLGGVGNEKIEVLSGMLNNAQLDSIPLKPMATLLTNLDDINTVYQTYMDGMLGYEFFAQQPLSINYRKKRLTIYRLAR